MVSTPTISEEADGSNTGQAIIDVTFSQTSDLPASIASGLSYYALTLYIQNGSTFTQVGSTVSISYNSSSNTYSYQFDDLDDNSVYKVGVRAYDANGNYSAISYSSTCTVPNYSPPGAPQDVEIDPSGWTDGDEVTISWGDISGDGEISRVEYSIDGGVTYTSTQKNSANNSFDLDTSSLPEGATTILLRAVYDNQYGTFYGDTSSVTYYKDTIDPTVSITNLVDNHKLKVI
jgi:hypothetical protein